MNWSEIFNSAYSRWLNQRSAQAAAAYVGYPFYLWKDIIYHTDNDIPTAYVIDRDDNIVISTTGKTDKSFGIRFGMQE
jgi:hypothetical protein